ncbi:MAG: helix-turn-helix transcriptional regulator [Intestinibacillus sp.]
MRRLIDKSCVVPASRLEESHPDYEVYRTDWPDGSFGRMTMWPVLPGITLSFNDFHTYGGFQQESRFPGAVEINHCLRGRYECVLPDGRIIYLGAQDLSVSDMSRPPRHSCFLLGEYYGISLIVETECASHSLRALLGSGFPALSALFEQFFGLESCLLLRADPKVQHIFSELYDAPSDCRAAYFRLKTAELFLFLSRYAECRPCSDRSYYCRSQTQRMESIAHRLASDLQHPPTLDELAAQYGMGRTRLEQCFRETYGEPPYAYLKRRRLAAAGLLLQTTDKPIGEIAAEVGYQNASKFSAAFQALYGMTPRVFRKGVLLEQSGILE